MPAETHVEQGRSTATPSSRSCGTDWPTSWRSIRSDQRGAVLADDLDADSLALIELVEALEEELVSAASASASRTRTSRT